MAERRHCWDLRRGMNLRLADVRQKQQAAECLARDRQRLAVMKEEEGKEERRRHIWQVKEKPRETQVESALPKAEDRINRRKQLEKEERIAKELERQQCIEENSVELRELEMKLKSASLYKERAALIAEQEAMRFKTMRDKVDRSRKMERESGAAVEKDREAMEQKLREIKKAEEEEEAFRKKMMVKFAEDDRIEQMDDQKRRMKQLQHKRVVTKLIQDMRRQHQAKLRLEARERALEQAREALREQISEEERPSSTGQ